MTTRWSRPSGGGCELLDRKRWKTRIELASSIHDYIELFHNTRRRHSALGMMAPTEYETIYSQTNQAATLQNPDSMKSG